MGGIKKRTFLLSIIGLLLLGLLIITWLYPYSSISFIKSVSYDADNVIVEEYVEDLNEFKKTNPNPNFLENVLPMYEQDWLITKKPIKIRYNDLDKILLKVEQAKNTLVEFSNQGDYSRYAEDFLKTNIDNCIAIEEEIKSIKESKKHSKKTLRRQFHNLQVSFINNFRISFLSFYEETIE